MKYKLLISTVTLALATGCLPTRESHPFGESANNGEEDAGNNGTLDAANNGTDPDAANNGTNPDAANNGIPDAANNGTPDGCTPESDTVYCERQSAECGTLAATDNCGAQRSIDCGTCTNNEPCNNNVCGGCTPESNQEFCDRLVAECGALTALDNCRNERTFNCGGCPGNGVGCNLQNTCQEVDCRDGIDNDQAGGADCADPVCLGQQCTGNPNKTCQNDGTCN